MNEPLNYNGPTADAVLERLREYLTRPVLEKDSSWPVVTDEDMKELHGMFSDILEAKFQRDCDGDMVMQYAINRRTYGYMHAIVTPNSIDSDEELAVALDAAQRCNSIAENIMQKINLRVRERLNQKRRQAEIQPIKDVAEVLAVAGYKALSARLMDWYNDNWAYGTPSLFIGRQDQLWEPLGLNCKQLQDAQRDFESRGKEIVRIVMDAAQQVLEEQS